MLIAIKHIRVSITGAFTYPINQNKNSAMLKKKLSLIEIAFLSLIIIKIILSPPYVNIIKYLFVSNYSSTVSSNVFIKDLLSSVNSSTLRNVRLIALVRLPTISARVLSAV